MVGRRVLRLREKKISKGILSHTRRRQAQLYPLMLKQRFGKRGKGLSTQKPGVQSPNLKRWRQMRGRRIYGRVARQVQGLQDFLTRFFRRMLFSSGRFFL